VFCHPTAVPLCLDKRTRFDPHILDLVFVFCFADDERILPAENASTVCQLDFTSRGVVQAGKVALAGLALVESMIALQADTGPGVSQ
jgi:hypothetical protein